MQTDVSRLESAWLRAEAMVDEARSRLAEADRVLAMKKKQMRSEELTILMSTIEAARADHAAAEQMACDAFDLFWQASGQNNQHSGQGDFALRRQSQEQMNA